MARKHYNFFTGTLTASLPTAAVDATGTLTASWLASFPAVNSPDIAAVIVDPAQSAGAPEIVWITAHTAAAGTSTIKRGQEGSTPRAHANGIACKHGPTALDVDEKSTVDSPVFTTQVTVPKVIQSAGPQILAGTGTPEGVVAAPVGSLYQRSNGAGNTTLYVKESGTGNTGWVAYIAADSSRVAKAGDTMTGPLSLSGAPTAGAHAATKSYVDTAVGNLITDGFTLFVDDYLTAGQGSVGSWGTTDQQLIRAMQNTQAAKAAIADGVALGLPFRVAFRKAGTWLLLPVPGDAAVAAAVGTWGTARHAALVLPTDCELFIGPQVKVQAPDGFGRPEIALTSVTSTASSDLFTKTAHGYVNGDLVYFTGTSIPAGLTACVPYFVVGATSNTFQVSTVAGGGAINITADGTGHTSRRLGSSDQVTMQNYLIAPLSADTNNQTVRNVRVVGGGIVDGNSPGTLNMSATTTQNNGTVAIGSVSTLTVASTTGFDTAGHITVKTSTGEVAVLRYTGTTATTFTGCTLINGAGGNTVNGNYVDDAKLACLHGISMRYCENFLVQDITTQDCFSWDNGGYSPSKEAFLFDSVRAYRGDFTRCVARCTGHKRTTTTGAQDVATFTGSGTLNVASTTGFASSGTIIVETNGAAPARIDYTGTTATTFTGCTTRAGAGLTASGGDVRSLLETMYGNAVAANAPVGRAASGFSANFSNKITWTKCEAYNIKPGEAATTGGRGFTHYDSGQLRYLECIAYCCQSEGFAGEQGQDVIYQSCVSGGETVDIESGGGSIEPIGENIALGNGGFGFQYRMMAPTAGNPAAKTPGGPILFNSCISRKNGQTGPAGGGMQLNMASADKIASATTNTVTSTTSGFFNTQQVGCTLAFLQIDATNFNYVGSRNANSRLVKITSVTGDTATFSPSLGTAPTAGDFVAICGFDRLSIVNCAIVDSFGYGLRQTSSVITSSTHPALTATERSQAQVAAQIMGALHTRIQGVQIRGSGVAALGFFGPVPNTAGALRANGPAQNGSGTDRRPTDNAGTFVADNTVYHNPFPCDASVHLFYTGATTSLSVTAAPWDPDGGTFRAETPPIAAAVTADTNTADTGAASAGTAHTHPIPHTHNYTAAVIFPVLVPAGGWIKVDYAGTAPTWEWELLN